MIYAFCQIRFENCGVIFDRYSIYRKKSEKIQPLPPPLFFSHFVAKLFQKSGALPKKKSTLAPSPDTAILLSIMDIILSYITKWL